MTRDEIITVAKAAEIQHGHTITATAEIIETLLRFANLLLVKQYDDMLAEGYRWCAKGQRTTQLCGEDTEGYGHYLPVKDTTDRELIELAAKAMHMPENYANTPYMEGWYSKWNPIKDDGDALRLAVKLGLLVHGTDSPTTVWCQVGDCPAAFLEAAKPDPYAATRRAITRAAAEIGRNMK